MTKDVTAVTGRCRECSGEHNGPVDDRDRTGRERPRRGAARHGAVEAVAAAVAGAFDEAVDHLVDDAAGVRADGGQADEAAWGGLGDHDLQALEHRAAADRDVGRRTELGARRARSGRMGDLRIGRGVGGRSGRRRRRGWGRASGHRAPGRQPRSRRDHLPPAHRLPPLRSHGAEYAGLPVADGVVVAFVLRQPPGEEQQLQRELGRAGHRPGLLGARRVEPLGHLGEHGVDGAARGQGGHHLGGGHPLPRPDRRLRHGLRERGEVEAAQPCPRGGGGSGAQEVFEVLGLPALFAGGELQLAAQHVGHRLEVDGTGHGAGLAGERGPAQRGGGHRLGGGHGEPGRHARTLVDGARLAQGTGEAGDDLPQVAGHLGDQLGLLVDAARPRRPAPAGSACAPRRRSGP